MSRPIDRRQLLWGALMVGAAGLWPRSPHAARRAGIRLGPAAPFDPAELRVRARALAARPYRSPAIDLPPALARLDYDRHRDIRFRPEMALWHGDEAAVEAQFFHLGYHFKKPVQLHEVADAEARQILYAPELFDFGKNGFEPDFPDDLGFAGFRLHTALNAPDYLDELAVFLGASYFRALGRGQRYGLSARGIAIDSGLASGEEFPDFTSFWLERPIAGQPIRLHALLDGPSVAGAFTFAIRPGATTTMDVDATLCPRSAIELLGIAPLTSMFLFGPNDRLGVDDFRPAVHDSDGLQIWTGGGEWLWRPLANPEQLRLSVFRADSPKGFGLLQRGRDFAAYQDLEARYELRPSLWVEPLEGWGRGAVRLIELPSAEEIHDNVVTFWVPEAPVEAGSEWRFRYRLHWCLEAPFAPPGARVVATRVGQGGVPGQARDPASRKFVLDFAGGALDAVAADAPLEAVVATSSGRTTQPVIRKNDVAGGWRVFFDLHPDGPGPIELRCFLRLEDTPVSETWLDQWTG